jgi:enoyl-CoA hydratase/carnithine racemase
VGPELATSLSDGVLRLVIDRPERRNALSFDVIAGLRQAIERARGDPEVRVVVVTGAGDEAFSAGADLGSVGGGAFDAHLGRGELPALFRAMWGLGKPTIARVQGWALAGGFGLALACDLLVASERARFGTPEVGVGLWPYMVTVPMLRAMLPKRALELMLTGRVVDAVEAERLGFVTKVVPHDQLDEAVEELVAALASRSPAVLRLGLGAFYGVVDALAGQPLDYLQSMLSVTASTEDAKEGIAAFLEKRSPVWRGR